MSQDNPIVIDQDENVEQMRQKAMQTYNQLLKDMTQTTPRVGQFQIYLLIAKSMEPGSIEEKENIIRRRIKKFFQYHVDVQSGFFHPRLEADYSDKQTKPLPDSLIMYGVDFLATKNIRKKFEKYDPEVQWIDDSHCKLNFTSGDQVKEFLKDFVKDKEKLDVKMQVDAEEQALPRNWFELYPPYYELNFERKLFVRYATTKELNIKKNQNSKFVGYYNFKKQFQENFLRDEEKKVLLTRTRHNNYGERRNFHNSRPYEGDRQYSRSRNKRYPQQSEGNRRFNRRNQSEGLNNSRTQRRRPAFSRRSSISMSQNNLNQSRITIQQGKPNQNNEDSFSMPYRDDKEADRNEQLNLSIVQHMREVNLNESLNQDISMQLRPEQEKQPKNNDQSFESLLQQDSMQQPERSFTKNNQSFQMTKKATRRDGPLNRRSQHSYKDYDKKKQAQEQIKKKQIQFVDLQDENQW